jgi:hypothetical protein
LTGLWASGFLGFLHRRQVSSLFQSWRGEFPPRLMTPALKQASPSFARWNQLGIGPSSPAGNCEYLFLDFCLGVIFCASRLRCGIFEVRSVHIAGSRSFYGAGQLEEPRSISFARLEQSRGRRA